MRGGSANPVHPKNQCRATFLQHGEAAMRKLAVKFGINSEAKLRRWAEEFAGAPSSRTIKKRIAREPLVTAKAAKRGIGARVRLTRWALGPEMEGAEGVLIPHQGFFKDCKYSVRLKDGFEMDVRDYEYELI